VVDVTPTDPLHGVVIVTVLPVPDAAVVEAEPAWCALAASAIAVTGPSSAATSPDTSSAPRPPRAANARLTAF
jgi:hypothetical protein